MSFGKGALAAVYVNGYNLGQFLKEFSDTFMQEKLETTCLGATDKSYIPGEADGAIKAAGLYSGDVGESEAILIAALGQDPSVWTYLPGGDSGLGAAGKACKAIQTTYDIKTPVAGLQEVSADGNANQGMDTIKSLHPLASVATGSVSGSSIDNAASSSAGGVGYLHVMELTATSVDVIVEDSADNASWATLITFTQVTAAHRAERIALAATATVRRYLRYSATVTGAGAATLHASFARK